MPAISFGAQSASPAHAVTVGQRITFTTQLTASCAVAGLVDFEVYTAGGKRIWSTWHANQQLSGQSQTFTGRWPVPDSQSPGGYYVSIGVCSPGWARLWAWKHQAAIFSVQGAGSACATAPTIHFAGASAAPTRPTMDRGCASTSR